MKNKSWFLSTKSLQMLIRKITKRLQMLIAILVVLFVMQVSAASGEVGWYVWELTCTPYAIGCWDQGIGAPANIYFYVTFTNGFLNSYGAGWVGTLATCPNGTIVQNNAFATNDFFWVGYEHSAFELSRFNKIFTTILPGTLEPTLPIGNGVYSPAVTLYFPELCPPIIPPGGGGCLSGHNTLGEKFEKGDSSNICSPCDPDPSEIIICQQSGGTYDYSSCQCGQSPIVIDVSGNGYNLTNAVNGIQFDINGDGTQDRIAWSSANSDDAWLALDRNDNGLIDSGKELFGNSTRQPAPPVGEAKNGFLALAVFDKFSEGGNADGKIDYRDAVFTQLRLWQDINHNGISETNELKTLGELGLAVIDLDYQESRRTDENGNRFRYRAKVRDGQGAQIGRWAWDVYLVTQHSGN